MAYPMERQLTTCTVTGPAIGTTSTTALAANPARMYACFINESDKEMWLQLGTTAVKHQGIYLDAGDRFEITQNNLYTGIVTALADSSGKILAVIECV